MLILHIFFALLGLFVLLKAAEVFAGQATSLAAKLKISSFVVGFTIVAGGTSLPELVVCTYSSIIGHSDVAVSAVVGSNIANLCLILGLLALYKTYRLTAKDVHVNLPANSIAILVFLCLLLWFNLMVSWEMGLVLMVLFFIFILVANKGNHAQALVAKGHFRLITFVGALAVLLVAGKVCIDSVIAVANDLNIAETMLGYFFVAIGTSLPELVTSFVAIKSGDEELSIGNVMGSSLFNLFFIVGLSSFFTDLDFSGTLYGVGFMALATVLTLIFALTGKRYYFSKKEAVGLLAIYLLFAVTQIVKG